MNKLGINIITFITSIPSFILFLGQEFLPPDLSLLSKYIPLIYDALSISLIASVISSVIALFLALICASNAKLIPCIGRIIMMINTILRNIPFLVWASILVIILGIGKTPGIISLIILGVSFLTRIFSEAIESIDKEVLDSIASVGASKIMIIRHGIFPIFMPTFYSWSTFMFEINIRASAILGLVGAGGIGYEIKNSLSLFRYSEASLIIVLLAFTILIIEYSMDNIRKRLV